MVNWFEDFLLDLDSIQFYGGCSSKPCFALYHLRSDFKEKLEIFAFKDFFSSDYLKFIHYFLFFCPQSQFSSQNLNMQLEEKLNPSSNKFHHLNKVNFKCIRTMSMFKICITIFFYFFIQLWILRIFHLWKRDFSFWEIFVYFHLTTLGLTLL